MSERNDRFAVKLVAASSEVDQEFVVWATDLRDAVHFVSEWLDRLYPNRDLYSVTVALIPW